MVSWRGLYACLNTMVTFTLITPLTIYYMLLNSEQFLSLEYFSKHIHENWWLSEHSQQPDLIFIITQYEDTQGFTISGLVCGSFLYYFIISHTNTDTHAHTVYLLCNSVHNFITKPLVSLSIYDSNRRRYIYV